MRRSINLASDKVVHQGARLGKVWLVGADHAKKDLDINWQALARLNHTLVFYMGLARADVIVRELQFAGMASLTPVAVIENGCRFNQRNLITELGDLPSLIEREQVQSPSLILIGQVVALAHQLDPEYWHSLAAASHSSSEKAHQRLSA